MICTSHPVLLGRSSFILTKYSTGDKIWEDELGEACGLFGQKRNPYTVLARKPEGKRTIGRSSHRWEDIKVNLKAV
jgi:hypothetical protein